MKVIVYRNTEGLISVVYPTPEAVDLLGINTIALKDVPDGVSFKIIDISEVPAREDRLTWTIPDSEFNDGVGTAVHI